MNPDVQSTGLPTGAAPQIAGKAVGQLLGRLRAILPIPAGMVGAAFYTVLGSGILRLAQALGVLMLARAMSPAAFGRVSLIQCTLAMLVAVGGLGGGQTATRLVSQHREARSSDLNSAVSLALAVSIAGGLLVALLGIVFAESICSLAFNDPGLAPLMRIGCISIVFASLWNGLSGTLQGFLEFRSVAVSQATYGLVLLFGFIFGVRYLGESGAIWAFVAAAAAASLAAAVPARACLARAGFTISPNWESAHFRILWNFSVPSMLSALISAPVVWLTSAILARSALGYESVASLNIASALRLLTLFVPLLLCQAVYPYAVSATSRTDQSSFERLMRGLHNGVAVPLNVLALLLAACVPYLSGLLGKPYRGLSEVSALLLVAVAIQGYGAAASVALLCSNRIWWGFALNLAWAAAVLVVSIRFVDTLDSSAVALGYAAGYALLVVSQVFLLRQYLSKRLAWRAIGGVLLNLVPATALAFAHRSGAGQWPVLLAAAAVSVVLWCPTQQSRGSDHTSHHASKSRIRTLNRRSTSVG